MTQNQLTDAEIDRIQSEHAAMRQMLFSMTNPEFVMEVRNRDYLSAWVERELSKILEMNAASAAAQAPLPASGEHESIEHE